MVTTAQPDLFERRWPKPKPPRSFVCITCGKRRPWKDRCHAREAPGEYDCPGCVHDRHVASYRMVRDGLVDTTPRGRRRKL